MISHDTIIQNVLEIEKHTPDQVFARLIYPKKSDEVLTYGELLRSAKRFANLYKSAGLGQKQVLIIILKHGTELLSSFVGAMLYGAIPSVFAFPSEKISDEVYRKTLTLLLEVCDTTYVLTYPELAQTFQGYKGLSKKLKIMVTPSSSSTVPGTLRDRFGEKGTEPVPAVPGTVIAVQDIALLQHSSGTTGLKKGVALSNQSVINQLRSYSQAIQLTERDTIISWLPLYHDMGLIACLMLPLVTGVPVVMMSPFDWVQNPVILLETISREKGTLCWLPNFAYRFLASRIKDVQTKGLSLESMRAFINCAEPIDEKSHTVFYERFKSLGLKQNALATCYAMAENTFAVTQGGITNPVTTRKFEGREAVSSGRLIPNNKVRIVDENRKDLAEGKLGEIAIQSDSMLTGYYRRPDLTQQAIEDGWYFTGDMGYYAESELYVTGRKKDMIIAAGKNIYPQDIEAAVNSVEGIYPGRVSVFGIYNESLGTEEVIILAETDQQEKGEQTKMKLAIAQVVREEFECTAADILLLSHMWLRKSSSGKISRSANREAYLNELKKK